MDILIKGNGYTKQATTVDIAESRVATDRSAAQILATETTAKTPTESTIEENLSEITENLIYIDRVSVGRYFFDDLSADSTVMAQYGEHQYGSRTRQQTKMNYREIEPVVSHSFLRKLFFYAIQCGIGIR